MNYNTILIPLAMVLIAYTLTFLSRKLNNIAAKGKVEDFAKENQLVPISLPTEIADLIEHELPWGGCKINCAIAGQAPEVARRRTPFMDHAIYSRISFTTSNSYQKHAGTLYWPLDQKYPRTTITVSNTSKSPLGAEPPTFGSDEFNRLFPIKSESKSFCEALLHEEMQRYLRLNAEGLRIVLTRKALIITTRDWNLDDWFHLNDLAKGILERIPEDLKNQYT